MSDPRLARVEAEPTAQPAAPAPGPPGAPSAPGSPEAPGAPGASNAPGAAEAPGAPRTPDDFPTSEAPAELALGVEALLGDLERVTAERDQFLDAYRRAQADYENYRKSAQRRQEDQVRRALGAFVERLLPVLDACDAAMAHGASEVEPVASALYQALEKEGLQRLSPVGEPFDPGVAEAVLHEPGEGGEQVVSEVLRAGYLWNGRVLRPAMVKVTD